MESLEETGYSYIPKVQETPVLYSPRNKWLYKINEDLILYSTYDNSMLINS
jgi:hypothetical protein